MTIDDIYRADIIDKIYVLNNDHKPRRLNIDVPYETIFIGEYNNTEHLFLLVRIKYGKINKNYVFSIPMNKIEMMEHRNEIGVFFWNALLDKIKDRINED